MKKLIFGIVVLLFLFYYVSAQVQLPILNFEKLEPLLRKQNDTVYLINFWATWCAPCRKELPDIEKIGEKYATSKFKVILVSLDMPETLQSTLYPFLKKNNIRSTVLVLDDPDSNRWIDRVDSLWGGSIPATLIYRGKEKIFIEKQVDFNYLDSVLTLKFFKP
ncbi:MAG: TlpA family protein disulfide reductase [Bacteroidales bacterium]|nr:TlpA family protein disulfide reductase [Bacteroidales bacterium]